MSDEATKKLTEATESLRTFTSGDTPDYAKAIALMVELESAPVTPDSLRASGLNVVLKNLRKCADTGVVSGATALIDRCKAKIIAQAEAGTLQMSPLSATPTASGPPTSASGPSAAASGSSTASSGALPLSAAGSLKRGASDMSAADGDIGPRGKQAAPATPTAAGNAAVALAPLSTASPVAASASAAGVASPRDYDKAAATSAKAAAAEVRLALTGDALRDKVQKTFYNALVDMSGQDVFRVELAVSMETALLKHFGTTNTEYRKQWFLLLTNLNDPHNAELRQRLYSGELATEDIATVDELQLAPKAVRDKRDLLIKDANASRETDINQGAQGTDMFPCGKCKSRNCSYTQRQTRSADEPMTIFLRCLECNHRWRQY